MTAEDKAWQYFRQVLEDDEKYFALKNKKEPIMIDGSDGGKYFLYPDGNIARLDKDKPMVGRISFGKKMPFPDFLSSIVVWITKNEQSLKGKWGCGNINIYYGSDIEPQTEDGFMPFNSTERPIISLADWNGRIGVTSYGIWNTGYT